MSGRRNFIEENQVLLDSSEGYSNFRITKGDLNPANYESTKYNSSTGSFEIKYGAFTEKYITQSPEHITYGDFKFVTLKGIVWLP